ncbi:acyl-CoA synthetase [Streptomyces cadmiisoli]|uniref:acyl-CoA synthetase n=1 Tax=Streptomyces cadmiisoli TaxID=2184053 RepID=UPI003654BCB2
MRNHGIGSWTRRRSRKNPRRVALVHHDTRITYGQLHDRTVRLAHHLRHLGVRRGDRIAYLGPNHPAYLETMFATSLLGAVFVPLNTRLAEPELRQCLSDSGSLVLVHSPVFAAFADACGVTRRVSVDASYERALAGAETTEIDEHVSGDDLAMIMYTSGTTGRAKGAMLTHANVIWNCHNMLVDMDFASDEVTLLSAPLFHTACLNVACLPTLLKGGTVVLEETFSPSRTLDLIEEHAVTAMFGVPTMFQQIAAEERFDRADFSSMRFLMCGAAPVPLALIETYQQRGLILLQGYGMTEASAGIAVLDSEHAVAKVGSAGLPQFYTDVRVVDAAGRDTAPGERGELLVEGPSVIPGYWGLPAETLAAFTDGWLRSGDVAVRDDDGYLTIVDRIKDMIISGGENIYPAEVENALYQHPDVADCAVIGVPDEQWGEVGRAVVVRARGEAATAEDILSFLEGRLARYKIPKSVVFTDALPRSGVGKLLKPLIRKTYGTLSSSGTTP